MMRIWQRWPDVLERVSSVDPDKLITARPKAARATTSNVLQEGEPVMGRVCSTTFCLPKGALFGTAVRHGFRCKFV